MKLKGFDLDQVRAEASAIEDQRQHELKRGRKPPEDDTIRIPVALLTALLNRVDPPPSKGDFRLTTSGYVRPGCYIGDYAQPNKNNDVFCSPSAISAADLTDPPLGGHHPFLLSHFGLDSDFPVFRPDDVTFVPGNADHYYETDAKVQDLNLHFVIPGSDVSLVVDAQTGNITHCGRVVGHVPSDGTGTLSIEKLTATCRYNHSMSHVVVDDVKVNE